MERNKTRCRVTANRNTHKHTQLSHLERTLILCLKIPMTPDPGLGTRRHKKGKANACKLWVCMHVVQGCIWKCHWKQNGRRARDKSFSYFCARVSVGACVEFMLEAHRHILCRATGRRGWFSMNLKMPHLPFRKQPGYVYRLLQLLLLKCDGNAWEQISRLS